ncbi:hypothetical protein BKA69DRAFT_1130701 [Paraphysoderma sedebokerense]|nr:hypothetical protein BKA69DRAFT_1130701 [Paraphysoderma sedebokerense]
MIALTTLAPFLAAMIGLAMAAPTTNATSENFQRTRIYVRSFGLPLTQTSPDYTSSRYGSVQMRGAVDFDHIFEPVYFKGYYNVINNPQKKNDAGNTLMWLTWATDGRITEYVTRNPNVWSEEEQQSLKEKYGGRLPNYNTDGWGLDEEAGEGDNWLFDIILDCNKYPEFLFNSIRHYNLPGDGPACQWEDPWDLRMAKCGETTYMDSGFKLVEGEK